MIKDTYNYVFKPDWVYGLGEAVIVSKQKTCKTTWSFGKTN